MIIVPMLILHCKTFKAQPERTISLEEHSISDPYDLSDNDPSLSFNEENEENMLTEEQNVLLNSSRT
jgi:hypothetical protein